MFLFAQQPERYARIRVELGGRPISELAELGIETDHGQYVPDQFLQTDLSESELKTVQNAGFQTRTIIADVQAAYRADLQQHPPVETRGQTCQGVNTAYATPTNYTYGTMGGYLTYQQMLDVLDEMAAKYPQLITQRAAVSDTILTHEGRPMWYVKISDNASVNEAEPQVLYDGLHHAREPNSMSQLIFYMWYLLENYATDPQVRYIVDNEELYFIPCINPDGYIFNETTDPMGGGYWRKNRRMINDSTFGVDLNRNYGFQWGLTNQGSSPNPVSQTYRGPAPFSEPETRMMRDFCREHDFVFGHNYHTSGNLLIYPWAYNATLADSAFAYFGKLFTRENKYKIGTTLETVGYAVNGDSNDWMYSEKGTLAFTAEIGKTGFWPMPDEIDALNKANLWQNLATALSALRFGEVSDESADFYSQLNVDLPLRLTRYGFQDGSFTVSLQALTPNVTAVSAPQTIDLQQLKSKKFAFQVTLAPAIQPGEEFLLLLKTISGSYSHTDTLRKYYGGKIKNIFTENGTNINEWSGTWKTTDQSFVSAPSSVTDSPNGDYPSDLYSELRLTNVAVAIPAGAKQPNLQFFARWDIENNYDYVLVTATGANGEAVPLCGHYTNQGSGAQVAGAPLFDGLQPTWVEEYMDLSAFAGQSILLSFLLVSDGAQEGDGFYFDDLRIEYTDPKVLTTVTVPLRDFSLQNTPNPASTGTTISWEKSANIGGEAQILVFNIFGQQVLAQPVDLDAQSQVLLDTHGWQPGSYTYCIRSAGWQTAMGKMVVVHIPGG